MNTRTLAVVTAGLSDPSSTRLLAYLLATAASDALRGRGEDVLVEVVELRPLAHRIADHLLTGFATGDLAPAQEAVAGADGVIAVTPVFTASYSGLFKSFFDVLDPEAVRGTPVLMAATAGTARHSLVLEHALRPMFAHLRAVTVPTAVFAASEDWGDTRDGALADRIGRAANELADLVAARPARPMGADQVGAADGLDDLPDFETLLRG